jgi:hypothetical protein
MAVSCAQDVRYANPSSSSLPVLRWSPTMRRPPNGCTSSYASCQYIFGIFIWPFGHSGELGARLQRTVAMAELWLELVLGTQDPLWQGPCVSIRAQISLAHVASIPSKTSKFCTELISSQKKCETNSVG